MIVVNQAITAADDVSYPLSWCVTLLSEGEPDVSVLWGFSTKRDAEIVHRWLGSLAVDWSMSRDVIGEKIHEAGFQTRKALMEEACKRLLW